MGWWIPKLRMNCLRLPWMGWPCPWLPTMRWTKCSEMQLNRSSKQHLPKVYAVLLTRLTSSCSEETHPNEWRELLSTRWAGCAKARALHVLVGGLVLLNLREYWRGRGRGARTSTYTCQSGYQQPEVNKMPTKAPNNWYVNSSRLLDVVNAQKPVFAGRTNQCSSEWVKLTTDPEILDIVKQCHIEFS